VIVNRTQRRVVYIVMIVSVLNNAMASCWNIAMCGNPKNYLINVLDNKCVSRERALVLSYIQGSINAITDIILATLPIFLLWSIHMKRRLKIYTGFILILATM
jgi:hypothetical protein